MFSDNLKKYRTAKGLSQNDVAEKLFVTRQCVSKWENGTTQPDLQALESLSDLLGVSIDDLVKDNGEEKKKKTQNGNNAMFIANVLTAAFCVLALLVLWRFLPETVPMHWSVFGDIDRYGSRNEILLMFTATVAILGVDAIEYFVFRKYNFKISMYLTHSLILFFQFAFVVFMWVMYAKYVEHVFSIVTCLTTAALMCLSVAVHPKINKRQNHIMGIRTSATLNSTTVWNKTNALACYMFIGCAAVIFTVNMIVVFPYCYLCLVAYMVPAIVSAVYAKLISKTTD